MDTCTACRCDPCESKDRKATDKATVLGLTAFEKNNSWSEFLEDGPQHAAGSLWHPSSSEQQSPERSRTMALMVPNERESGATHYASPISISRESGSSSKVVSPSSSQSPPLGARRRQKFKYNTETQEYHFASLHGTSRPSTPSQRNQWALHKLDIMLPSSPASTTQENNGAASTVTTPAGAPMPPLTLEFDFDACTRSGVQFIISEEPMPHGALVVASVHRRSALASSVLEGPGLMPGDVILEVDHVGGTAAELRQLVDTAIQSGVPFTLLVQPRPAIFDVQLKRQGPEWGRLGVALGIDRSAEVAVRLRVLHVHEEGLLADWNAAHSTARVCTGDWIAEVNGVSENASKLYAAMRPDDRIPVLRLKVATPLRSLELTGDSRLKRSESFPHELTTPSPKSQALRGRACTSDIALAGLEPGSPKDPAMKSPGWDRRFGSKCSAASD